MHCPRCGIELERPGQGHTCRSVYEVPAVPPTRWVVATWLVVGFGALLALDVVAAAAIRLTRPGQSTGISPALLLTSVFSLVCVAGTGIGLLLFNRETRRAAESYGADPSRYTRSWYLRVYGVAVLLTAYLEVGLGAHERTLFLTGVAFRAGSCLLIVVGVLIVRSRVLELIADSVGQSRAAQHVAATTPLPPPMVEPAAGRPPAPDPWPEPEPWPDPQALPDFDSRPAPPPPRSRRPRPSTELTPLPGDWDAHQWDPETQRDILRRRRDPAP